MLQMDTFTLERIPGYSVDNQTISGSRDRNRATTSPIKNGTD